MLRIRTHNQIALRGLERFPRDRCPTRTPFCCAATRLAPTPCRPRRAAGSHKGIVTVHKSLDGAEFCTANGHR